MDKFAPPLCFLLAIAMLVCGFGMWAVGAPEESAELHRARASGDEDYEEALGEDLAQRQTRRLILLASLFGGSLVMVGVGFVMMRPKR